MSVGGELLMYCFASIKAELTVPRDVGGSALTRLRQLPSVLAGSSKDARAVAVARANISPAVGFPL